MKTWNFGIIGAGLIADFHARAIGDIPNAKLVGICDVVAPKAEKLARTYSCRTFKDYEEMVQSDDIDIVTIATPSGLHMEPALAAAQNGKHVICEKPLEITLERIDNMIEAHKKAGTRLGGIFPSRFNDSLEPIRNALAAGRFGIITYAGAYVPWWRAEAYYKDTWHGTWKLDGGGALMNQSIHTIDLLCELMPPVESIMAFTGKPAHPQIETEDTAAAALRFTNGALGVIYGTTGSFPGQLRRLEITGTKGTLVYVEDSISVWQFDQEEPQDEGIRKQFGTAGGSGGAADPAAIDYGKHTSNIAAFLDALEKDSDFSIDGAEARKAVELILSIYKSAQEEKIVRLT